MLKFHPITAFMKMHANFQKIFLIRVFWCTYIFPFEYKIRILDLMLLLKNSVPFEGLYYSSVVINLLRKRKLFCFTSFDFLMSCDCKCPVAPPGAAGWSAVCDCYISCAYSCYFCTCSTSCISCMDYFV